MLSKSRLRNGGHFIQGRWDNLPLNGIPSTWRAPWWPTILCAFVIELLVRKYKQNWIPAACTGCHPVDWDYLNSLQWLHNGRDSVSNNQLHDCLLNRLFRRRSKKTSKLRATGLCEGNSPKTGEFPAVPGEFPAQMASNAEMSPFDDVSMWMKSTKHRYNFLLECMDYPDLHEFHTMYTGHCERRQTRIFRFHWKLCDVVVKLISRTYFSS